MTIPLPMSLPPLRTPRPAPASTQAIGENYLFSYMEISPAEAIAWALRIFFPDAQSALDATYGQGGFWDGAAPVQVIGLDLNPKRASDVVADYRMLPFIADAFDVGIFDPPFLSDGGKQSIMRKQYTTHATLEVATATIQQGCRELWRVSRLGIIVKVQDHHHGQRFNRLTRWVEDAIPVPIYDEIIAPNEQPKIIDPKWQQPQLSTYRTHSTYLIFRKDGPLHRRHRQRERSHTVEGLPCT